MSAKDTWKTDWETFVGFLGEKLRNGEGNEDLVQIFQSEVVLWSGHIERIDIDKHTSTVRVSMPEATFELPNGKSAHLKNLTLGVGESNQKNWQKVCIGDQVEFSATFYKSTETFPCVEVKTLSSGKLLLFLRLGNAIPTKVKPGRSQA